MVEDDELLFDERLDEPMVWSASGLKTVASCGKQWHFRYRTDIKGIQTPYLAFGKAVHKVVELMHQAKDFTEEFWVDAWDEEWYQHSQDVDWTGYYKGNFTNNGQLMLRKYAKKNKNAVILQLESPFPRKRVIIQAPGRGGPIDALDQYGSIGKPEYKIGQFVVRGVIDQIRRMDDGRLLVVDLKTSKYPLDPLVLRADPQFTIYWHVARQMYPGEDPLMALYHLESGKMLYTSRTDNDVLMVEAMIKEGQRKVDLKMFERNIGQTCRYCPFVTECLGNIGDNVEADSSDTTALQRTTN